MIFPKIRRNRRAFTLVEILVVSALMILLAMVLTSLWSGLGRPLVEASARAQIAQDANLAAAALAGDFGGSLTNQEERLGGLADGKLVGRMQPDGSILRLCFDGGTPADGLAEWGDPDTVISYEIQNGDLVRWDERAGTTFTVARNVQQMVLEDLGTGVEIQLTFAYRNVTRTYTLVGLDP
jgi:type II secretory pathway pseudopilin PulG